MKAKYLIAFAAVMTSVSVYAGDPGHWFEKVDANGDGYLSADELGEKKAYKITKIDADGDSMISRAEFDAYQAEKHSKKSHTS